jgi:hypothetical protein
MTLYNTFSATKGMIENQTGIDQKRAKKSR